MARHKAMVGGGSVGMGADFLLWQTGPSPQEERGGRTSHHTQLTLWGIDVDTLQGTFTLPHNKIDRAKEFLAGPEFDPWHTRIP